MANETVSQKERIAEVLKLVETETGMTVSSDRYPCFLRIGDNWGDYTFNWEPFRDLAGPLKWPESAPLIVMISTKKALNEPLVETYQEPHAHNRIMISPGIPLAVIVETWIAQIAGYLPTPSEPNEFFLKDLELKISDVSPEVIRFLGLESATKTKPIEKRMRSHLNFKLFKINS